MKTERRHELQTNQLADALGREVVFLRPYFKTILGVVIAIAAVGFTIAFLSQQQTARQQRAWGAFLSAAAQNTPEELEKFAQGYPDTAPAAWAELIAAEDKLRRGSELMFRDRTEAESLLEQARKTFQMIADRSVGEPMIARRAQFGLAMTLEAMNNPDDAESRYAQLAKAAPDDPFGKAAAERLSELKRLNDQQWFAWFSQYEPPATPDPLGGQIDLNNLPRRDDLPKRSDLPTTGLLEEELQELERQFRSTPKPPADDKSGDATEPAPDSGDEVPAEPPADDAAPDDETPEEAPPAPPEEEPGPEESPE